MSEICTTCRLPVVPPAIWLQDAKGEEQPYCVRCVREYVRQEADKANAARDWADNQRLAMSRGK